MTDPSKHIARLPFALIAGFCLLQISWWSYFLVTESTRAEACERDKIQSDCYQAVLELAPILQKKGLRSERSNKHIIDEIVGALSVDFPELELAPADANETTGIALGLIVSGLSSDLANRRIRPSASVLNQIASRRARKRRMFIAEGITFTLMAVLGIALLYSSLNRSFRIRLQHEHFLASATHELKTPLATLKLGLQSLEQQTVSPEKTGLYLRQMVGQVDRLEMEIVNMLVTASGDSRAFQMKPGNLLEDLDEVLTDMNVRIQARNLTLELDTPDEIVWVDRDTEAIKQSLRNILDNALKYSPSGGVIRVKVVSDDHFATLTVEDEGPGIPVEDREKIFEKFYRGDSADNEARGGTGLGLYLARQTLQAHGGSLAVASHTASHAHFILQLPILIEQVQ